MDTEPSSKWIKTTLGEVVHFYDYMRIPLSRKERIKRQGPYPYYGASGVIDHIDDYLFDGKYLLIAEDGENLNSRKTPIAFFADGKFWVNNHAHVVRAMAGVSDDYFLLAWFAQANISGYITGAAQPKLSQANLKRIELYLPPYLIQKKIASILSAYDDLIENNIRRIKILEEVAQNLYREWFVKFRFPGHQKVRMVDSPLGKVPEGWEVVKLKDVASINAKAIKPAHAPLTINYVDISSVSTGSIDHIEMTAFKDAPSRARRVVQHGDIIWSTVRPNRRSHCLIIDPKPNLIVSTGFAVITPFHVPFAFLYQCVTTDEFVMYLVNHAKGAAYPAVSSGDFEDATIIRPSEELLQKYESFAQDFFLAVETYRKRNEVLRKTRDLLLPRLISGELDVSDLDIQIREGFS